MGLLSTFGAASGRAYGFTRSAIAAATDAFFNRVTLLLPGNGTNGAQNNTFLDSSTNNFTITRNGNTTQGTFSPFSQTGWSNYFPNTYLSAAANNAFSFGTGNFTIEAWVYPTVGSVYRGIFANGGASTGSFAVYLTNGDTVRLDYYGGGGVGTTTTVALNTWSHIVVARSGSTISIFINGTRQATTTTSDNNTTNACYIGASWGGASDYMQGYMSNLRIVKGTAVYDPTLTTLTVPTAALTAVSGTSLLTCQSNRFIDNSSNAFAITVNGTPSVQAFSPFAPTAAYSAATNGGSGYTDGTGDYLSAATSTAFDIMGGSYTIEYWFYPVSVATAIMVDRQDPNSPYTGYSCRLINSTSNSANLNWDPGVSGSLTTTTTPIKINQWNHIAYTCDGTTLRIYANGKLEASTTTLSSSNYNGALTIGARATNTQPTNAYFSGFILRKGTATYTGSTYTVPTAPPTNITNTSLLCNFTNAGITDATAKNDLETVGNAQISTTQSKFGGSSIYLDGTGDYLRPNSGNIFNFGTGDFTVEFWLYLNSTAAQTFIDCRPGSAGDYILFDYDPTSKLRLYVGSTTVLSGSTLTTGQWYHIALARSGSTVRYFIDGTQGASATMTTNLLSAANPYIGSNYVPDAYVNGYIDDLRITKGYARYTANFTAPTAAFALQ